MFRSKLRDNATTPTPGPKNSSSSNDLKTNRWSADHNETATQQSDNTYKSNASLSFSNTNNNNNNNNNNSSNDVGGSSKSIATTPTSLSKNSLNDLNGKGKTSSTTSLNTQKTSSSSNLRSIQQRWESNTNNSSSNILGNFPNFFQFQNNFIFIICYYTYI